MRNTTEPIQIKDVTIESDSLGLLLDNTEYTININGIKKGIFFIKQFPYICFKKIVNVQINHCSLSMAPIEHENCRCLAVSVEENK